MAAEKRQGFISQVPGTQSCGETGSLRLRKEWRIGDRVSDWVMIPMEIKRWFRKRKSELGKGSNWKCTKGDQLKSGKAPDLDDFTGVCKEMWNYCVMPETNCSFHGCPYIQKSQWVSPSFSKAWHIRKWAAPSVDEHHLWIKNKTTRSCSNASKLLYLIFGLYIIYQTL